MTDEILKNDQEQEALPGASLLEYLPEIYRYQAPDNFLEHFLSPFASMLNEFDEKISSIPDYFDPATVPPPDELTGDFIPWLAQWLSLDLYELLGEKNKEFILKAVEFYKQKGTVPRIVNLLTFLTGKTCCVKEYANNVFRSYGMEHHGENEMPTAGPKECKKFFRTTSKTVDTKNKDLLAKIHKHQGYEDEVHYVTDTGISGKYAGNVIGLYIFINSSEAEFKFEKEQFHKIIKTFLPVFVRLEIFIVEMIDYSEKYPLNSIIDAYQDRVRDTRAEKIKPLTGVYIDQVNWNWLITNDTAQGRTNNKQYRTPHNGIGVEILF
jgi:phage tail-like protein